MQFNQSSKELFDLMFRLKEAKKRVRERREQEAAAAAAATEAAATTPARELYCFIIHKLSSVIVKMILI